MYLVYIHTCPNGKRYVGMTKRTASERWASGHGYSHCTDFYNAIVEFGWQNIRHEIVASGLQKEEAEQMERGLIAAYKTTDPDYGYNSHSGGLTGAVVSGKTKCRMSAAQSGSNNPRYGAKLSDETKQRISKAKTGKPLTAQCKKKLSKALGGEKNPSARRVCQYDLEMNFLKEWPYIRAAEKGTGANNISVCCRGKLKTSGGYIWRYSEEVGGA